MSFFTETMTVFNYIRDTETWQKSTIKGVQWSHDVRRVSTADGAVTYGKEESVSIDFEKNYGNPIYVEPVTFENLPDKKGYWTLNCLDKKDIVVLGEVAEGLTEGLLLTNLRKKYQYCGVVMEVSDNRNRRRLKHIEAVIK